MTEMVLVGQPRDAVCSTSTALVPCGSVGSIRPPIADVNGYYAELGVPPTATRAELLAAYWERGLDDPRITFCFKQLWNRATRADYDAAPAGEIFPDAYVMAEIMREAARAAARFAAAGQTLTAQDIFSSLLVRAGIDLPSEGHVLLDTSDPQGFDEAKPDPRHGDGHPGGIPWRYAFYQMTSDCTDTVRLARWQQALARTLAQQAAASKFAVGFHAASDEPVLVAHQDGIPVFLIHEDPQVAPIA